MSMSYQNQSKKTGLIKTFGVGVFFVFVAFLLISNKQYILDVISYWQYKPTTEIASIANRTELNDNGKFLFYTSQPKLDGSKDFNIECDKKENTSSILGCYNNSRIYIYDITETQLDGIREVTAAHEILHAAYARLDGSEKAKVDSLEEAEYKKIEDAKDLQEMMKYYDQTEPGQRDNELHSIIGTQVSNINSELENYYKKYFSNRQEVVALYAKYISVFTRLDNQAKSLASQLDSITTTINAEVGKYNSDTQTLNEDIQNFNSRADSGDFTSMSQFYHERSLLSDRVTALGSQKTAINSDISSYDALLQQYNSIASASKKLYNSIDSTLAPSTPVK